MRLPRTQFRGVAHFVYAKWPRSGPEVWRSAGVIATLWQPRLVSCAGLVGQVEVERVVTLPWAQWSSASGFCINPLVCPRLVHVGVGLKHLFAPAPASPKAKDARETDGIPLLLRPKARGLTAGCYGLGGETGFTPAQNTLTRNFSPRRASNKELYSTVAAGEMR